MAAGPTISMQKIIAASKGNPDLLEALREFQTAAARTQAATSTTTKAAPKPGQPNPAAPVPAQAIGAVSLLAGSYIVQITNPGASSAISQLQAAQAAQGANALTPLQPVTPIKHQIRASTSPAFNVNSNTRTFGGDTGSTQTFWTLTGLGKGTWYFQFRSTFDGINFNLWKNVNSGAAVGGLINQVTEENVGDANWALFTLPGNMVAGVCEGLVSNAGILDLATQIYSSGLFAIAGPNGYQPVGDSSYGVTLCDVDLQTPPAGQPGATGTPDYPVQIFMQYGKAHGAPAYWPGDATVFGFAVNPTSENVTFYPGPVNTVANAAWGVIRLPGGVMLAIGQGKSQSGSPVWVPSSDLPWFDWANSISISSFTDATDTGATPHGYFANAINSSGSLVAEYNDESLTWPTSANWLVFAWQPGAAVQTIGTMKYLTIPLQGNHSVVLGGGQIAVGNSLTLPAGYDQHNVLSICTPAGFTPSGHHFQGISQCALFSGLTPVLTYTDDSGNLWSGPCNVMLAAWK